MAQLTMDSAECGGGVPADEIRLARSPTAGGPGAQFLGHAQGLQGLPALVHFRLLPLQDPPQERNKRGKQGKNALTSGKHTRINGREHVDKNDLKANYGTKG